MLRRDTRMRAAVLRKIPVLFYLEVWSQMFQTPPQLTLALAPTSTLLFRESAHKENQLTWNSLRWILDSVIKVLVEMSFSCFIPVKHRHKDMHVEQKH
jgi:hypothetical protein